MSTNYQSLPSWAYNSEAFFELEKQHLFLGSWQLVCHLSNISNNGDYFTFELFNERVMAIRGHDGTVRAFHNVCAHRAARLLDGDSGNCGKRLTCPYHNWGYDLEGNLTNVPYRDQFVDFDESQNGLVPVEMEILQGFIFVRLKAVDGPSVADQFAPYLEELKPYRFEELEPMARVVMRPRKVNWKQIADNYVDALHIPIAHPGLSALVGNSYGVEVGGKGGYIHKMWSDVRKTRKNTLSNRLYDQILPTMDHLSADKQRHWVYYRLWPNLAFDVYPEQMDFMQFIPISATTTMIRELPYALPDDRREVQIARYLNWRINRQVNAEDTDLISRVQDGMGTSGYSSGPLAKTEVCLIDSAEKIRTAMPVSRLSQKPGEQDMAAINQQMLL
ncbi:MAG: aromatic ring-hydroxylating dioxygenase subunit alpha [Porticoccaceae bacterium]|nr:aromatic ring-hydroxylating dioxygenase subunit alpha [Porticoccaceae bacterium]